MQHDHYSLTDNFEIIVIARVWQLHLKSHLAKPESSSGLAIIDTIPKAVALKLEPSPQVDVRQKERTGWI